MPKPPQPPPPFCGHPWAVTPHLPFRFDPSFSKAIPAGNYLIVRRAHIPAFKKIDPTSLVANFSGT
ncbi:hypothetical protein DFH09DRAFT_1313031 [Mycena vulgaris]|nr:hypothetical protein DFH09DRAFT_1313031 [Mycena vulgaris]